MGKRFYSDPCALIALLVLLLGGCASDTSRWLNNPLQAADQTFRWTTAGQWRAADEDRPGTWVWHSGETRSAFGFRELLASWNPSGPAEGRQLTFWAQSRDAESGVWSPWLFLGQWGTPGEVPGSDQVSFAFGRVAVDVLELDRPAERH